MLFDHIGIFVKNLDDGKNYLQKTLKITNWSKPIDDKIQNISVQFGFDSSNIKYEIISPNGDNNPVTPLLKLNKNILNHVAYKVDDIDFEIEKLTKNGNFLIKGPIKSIAFNNKKIAFLYTPLKFVIELIQK